MKVKRINPFIAMDSTLVCLISVVILAPVLNIFASSVAILSVMLIIRNRNHNKKGAL